MNTSTSISYIKFLNLANAMRELTEFPVLNPMEEYLLNHIALAWHANKNPSVSHTMHTSSEMSPSTVHRHLTTLRRKGFVRLNVDERDNRVKFISHTPLSQQYFSLLGQCLSDSVGT